MSKPSAEEIVLLTETILTEEPSFCAVCFRENDITRLDNIINWIQCSLCGVWLHQSCVCYIERMAKNLFVTRPDSLPDVLDGFSVGSP